MQHIPHPSSEVEVRKAFQRLVFRTDVITTGAVGRLLVGGGVGIVPTWQDVSAAVDHGALGGLAGDDHLQYHTDARAAVLHFLETEHLAASAGVADSGKPIVLDAAGHVDATMINDGDIDHGSVGGLGHDDHAIYLLADGSRDLTGNLAVDAAVTIDGRDISVDGGALDTAVGLQHAEAHSIVSHNDTTATGTELETLTDNSIANALHRHSELVASDGAPDPALAVDADGGITINPNSHTILFRGSGVGGGLEGRLAIQAQTAAAGTFLDLYTKDGDGTDDMGVTIFAVGSPTSWTNYEILEFRWDGINSEFAFDTLAGGAGTVRPLNFYTSGNRNQLVLATDGSVSIGGALGVTGNITGPNVSSGADPGHTHTGASLGSIDISADTNLAATAPIILTDDTLTLDYEGTDFSVVDTTLTITNGGIDHDATANYDANKHIDHTGVEIATAATSGISGGGTIAATRNLVLNINGLTGESAIVAADTLAFYDNTAGANRKITFTELSTVLGASDEKVKVDAAATAGYLGVAAGDGVLRTGAPLTYTDGGDFVTLDVDQTDIIPSMTNNNVGAIVKGQPVYCDDNDDVDLADADNVNTSEVIGLVADASIASSASGNIRVAGILTATTAQWDAVTGDVGGLAAGTIYYLSDATPGTFTTISPSQVGVLFVRIGVGLSTTEMKLLIGTQAPAESAASPFLDANKTLYITTGGNDSTGDGSVSTPWATLNKALDWLSDKLIASNVYITIQFADGTYTRVATDTITHVNGDRIKIIGENTYDLTMSSIVSSSGSAGAWSIIVQVGAGETANAAVDNFLFISYNVSGGSLRETLPGCWKITNVDGVNHRLTVINTSQYGTAPSGAVSGTVTLIKTVLFYNGCNGITIGVGRTLGDMTKIALVGDGTGYGINMGKNSVATCTTPLGINNFLYGAIVTVNSFLSFRTCAACNCNIGIYLYFGNAENVYGAYVGNAYGIYALHGTTDAYLSTLSGNSNTGFWGGRNSTLDALQVSFVGNTTYGTYVEANTYMRTTGSTWAFNGTASSPVVNTLGNIESYIQN